MLNISFLISRYLRAQISLLVIYCFLFLLLIIFYNNSIKILGVGENEIVWQHHFDEVTELPEGSELLATNSHTRIQAYINYEQRLFGTQFHPEFDAVIVRAYVNTYAKKLRKEGKNPDTLLQEITDSPYGKIILQRFGEIIKQESNINQ